MKKIIGVLLMLLLVGCNAEDATPFVEQGFTGEMSPVQAVVQKEERIHHRQLVAAEDMVLVTYEVKPEFRVQKQRIERDLKKELEKVDSSLKFVVSGDFKLHYEARRLAKKELEKVETTEDKNGLDAKSDNVTDDVIDESKVDQKPKKANEQKDNEKDSVKKAIEELKKLAEEQT